MAELDKFMDIHFKFMNQLLEVKNIADRNLQNDATVIQFYNELFPYINVLRHNVSYAYQFFSAYDNSNFKTHFIDTVHTINETCDCLEKFCDSVLPNSIFFDENLAKLFEKFTYNLGTSIIKISQALKYLPELFPKQS